MAKKDFWAKQEAILIRIIIRALEDLILETDLPIKENDISRKLHYSLMESRRKEKNCLWHFVSQCLNQPVLEDKFLSYVPREEKKPDFTWSINDNMSNMLSYFNIECKRIEIDSKRNFFKQYVEDGVLRFKSTEHRYSDSVPLGVMIGYLRNCKHDQAYSKINKILDDLCLPKMNFVVNEEKNFKAVKQYSHNIDRPGVEPSPIKLRHLWGELM